MSLADRLGAAAALHRRAGRPRRPPPAAPADRGAAGPADRPPPAPAERLPRRRPAAAATRSPRCASGIHRALLEILGPQLYDDDRRRRGPGPAGPGDHRRRCWPARRRRSPAPTGPASPRRSTDEILGHGPIEPLLRDPEVSEIMVNGPHRIFVERAGRLAPVDAEFADEEHLRRVIDQIVVAGRPPGRRGEPDGRRPPARRQPGQRGRAADRAGRLDADDPQVRRRPAAPSTT